MEEFITQTSELLADTLENEDKDFPTGITLSEWVKI